MSHNSFEAEAENVTSEDLVDKIFSEIEVHIRHHDSKVARKKIRALEISTRQIVNTTMSAIITLLLRGKV